MFDPIHASLERARVRVRDLAAAWVLVALILGASVLPGALQSAKAEATEAATVARHEVALVLRAVPKMLLRAHRA